MFSRLLTKRNKKKQEIDLSYLIKYGSKTTYEIPHIFDKLNLKQGDKYQIRISNVYDPSKFWIVIRYKELEVFQTYLYRYYFKNAQHYKIPHDKIKENMYCIVDLNSAYYRGVIVTCTGFESITKKVKIYYIDYGLMELVAIDKLYYMSEECLKVPQFNIRATLSDTRPYKNETWTTTDVEMFGNLVYDTILTSFILNVDNERKIIEIHLSNTNDYNKNDLVHEKMIKAGIAEQISKCNKETETNKEKFKYPYLLPIFEDLENGICGFNITSAHFFNQIPAFHLNNDDDNSRILKIYEICENFG